MRIGMAYRTLARLRQGDGIDTYDAWSVARASRCIAKVLRRSHNDDTHLRRMLQTEAKLLLSLSHPHIVRAYELVEKPRLALILETLPGETLKHAIRNGRPLRARDLALLGLQLCSALHYLHGRGVLHLDLKPSNIIVQGGIVRLIDLGLARPPGPGVPGVGTDFYLAPEQARGETLTAATDVFGLGAVLFEAATGRPPFRSNGNCNHFEQLERRAEHVGKVRRLSRPLAEAIDLCLEPVPGERPAVSWLMERLQEVAAPPSKQAADKGDARA